MGESQKDIRMKFEWVLDRKGCLENSTEICVPAFSLRELGCRLFSTIQLQSCRMLTLVEVGSSAFRNILPLG